MLAGFNAWAPEYILWGWPTGCVLLCDKVEWVQFVVHGLADVNSNTQWLPDCFTLSCCCVFEHFIIILYVLIFRWSAFGQNTNHLAFPTLLLTDADTSNFAGILEATMEAWHPKCTLASPFPPLAHI